MRLLSLLLICFLMSSCKMPEPIEKVVEAAKRTVGMAFQIGSKVEPTPMPSSTPMPLKANAELLKEMMVVTFNQEELEDQPQFEALLSSMNQGASLEGIYRGLVMGSRYRLMESKAKAASPNAIKFFALEMADIQMEMKNPTHFTKESAKEYPNIDFPEGPADTIDFTKDAEAPAEKPKTKHDLAETVLENFIGATPYTLKRVLAEEVLKKTDEMKDGSGDIAQWYSSLVVHLADSKVDFGLPQRNAIDYDFHFRFAKTMSLDRVKWEILNRYHRILNSMN